MNISCVERCSLEVYAENMSMSIPNYLKLIVSTYNTGKLNPRPMGEKKVSANCQCVFTLLYQNTQDTRYGFASFISRDPFQILNKTAKLLRFTS